MRIKTICRMLIGFTLLLVAGCETVKPWDRDLLSRNR